MCSGQTVCRRGAVTRLTNDPWLEWPAVCSQMPEWGYCPAGRTGLSRASSLHTLHRTRPQPEGDSPGPKPSSTAHFRGGKKPPFMGEGLQGPFNWVEPALHLHLEHHGRSRRETTLGKAGPSPSRTFPSLTFPQAVWPSGLPFPFSS